MGGGPSEGGSIYIISLHCMYRPESKDSNMQQLCNDLVLQSAECPIALLLTQQHRTVAVSLLSLTARGLMASEGEELPVLC